MTYDGFGRLATRKIPAATTPTSYFYNADDTMQMTTDGRGATATFSYNNNRHLVTGISYGAPSGVTQTSAASYGYDEVGNRTSMTDGAGSASYVYNTLSQLQSETRNFNSLAGSYTLSYTYNPGGELTSITDPFGSQISYSYDQTGRMSSVTGTAFGGVTQYATGMQYRAWGALKHLGYGNNPRTLDISYNARLLPQSFEVSGVINKSYAYNADGTLSFSQDSLNSKFNRSYKYDHVGRVTEAWSGPAASGNADDPMNRPYKQFYSYDKFDHLTKRAGQIWAGPNTGPGGPFTVPEDSFSSDRQGGLNYDADGRMIGSTGEPYVYDAAGRMLHAESANSAQDMLYDGSGKRLRMIARVDNETGAVTTTRYEIRSSLTGDVITEVDETGQKTRGFAYMGESVLAVQKGEGAAEKVEWQHSDVSGASFRVTASNGVVDASQSSELDPLERDAGAQRPDYNNLRPQRTGVDYTYPGFADAINQDCTIWGVPMPCSQMNKMMEADATVAEYLIHDHEGFDIYTRNIEPAGIGLFKVDYPYFKPDNEGGPARLGWRANIFNAHQQSHTPLTPAEIDHLREDVQGLLKGKCLDFVKAVLKKLKAPTDDLMAIFNKINNFKRETMTAVAAMSGTIGKVETGTITGLTLMINYTLLNNPFSRADSGRVLIHELFHAATSSTTSSNLHYQMDQAAWDVANEMKEKDIGNRPEFTPTPTSPDTDVANVFNRLLLRFCRA